MRSILLVTALLGGLVACEGGSSDGSTTPSAQGGNNAQDIGEVLATVNGLSVGSIEFQTAAARATPADGKELSLEERREVLDRLIDDKVLYQEALRQGLDQDPKVQKVMVNTLLREEVYANVRNSDFTDEELQAYYETNKEEFVVPEKVQVKRILVRRTDDRPIDEAMAEAARIRGEIAADPATRFKDAATQYSEDPYRRRGGDVGFVSSEGKPGLDQDIVDKAFTLEVDELSEVFETADGANLILVANRRERVERTFQQMKGSVLRKVKNEKLKEMYETYVDSLKQGATISVNEDKLAAVEVETSRRPSLSAPGGLSPAPDLSAPDELRVPPTPGFEDEDEDELE